MLNNGQLSQELINKELEIIRRKLSSYTLKWVEGVIDDDLYHDLSIELIRYRDKLLVLKSKLDIHQDLVPSRKDIRT